MKKKSAIERVVEALRKRGCDPQPTPNGYQALCPAHDDNDPSLSVGEGEGGRALIKCHTGCDYTEILTKLGLKGQDLFNGAASKSHGQVTHSQPPGTSAGASAAEQDNEDDQFEALQELPEQCAGGRVVAKYFYESIDSPGVQLVKLRIDLGGGRKTFRWFRETDEGWVASLGAHKPCLYRARDAEALPDSLYLVEGEKAVDYAYACTDEKVAVTCGPHGSGSFRASKADNLQALRHLAKGRPVAAFVDRDDPGRQWAVDVARALSGCAKRVRFFHPKVTESGADLVDHCEAGFKLTKEDLVDITGEIFAEALQAASTTDAMGSAEAPSDPASPADDGLLIRPLAELAQGVYFGHPLNWIVQDMVAEGEAVLIAGDSGHGKSPLVADLALAIVKQGDWLGRPVLGDEERSVLWLDAEQGEKLLRRQFERLYVGRGLDTRDFWKLPISWRHGSVIDLSSPDFCSKLVTTVKRDEIDVVVVDSLSRAVGTTNLNNDHDANQIFHQFVQPLLNLNTTVIVIHHMAKTREFSAGAMGRIKNSGSIPGVYRNVHILEPAKKGKKRLRHARTSWGEKQDPTLFEFEDVPDGFRINVQAQEGDRGEFARRCIQDAGSAGISKSDLVDKFVARFSFSTKDSARKAVTRAFNDLAKTGEFVEEGGRGSLCYFWRPGEDGHAESA